MAEVVFVDTSVLLNLLDVPGKNSERVALAAEFKALVSAGAALVIPVAAVVEVGNRIAQLSSGGHRRDRAQRFAAFLRPPPDGRAPWVVSGASWDETLLGRLVDGHDPAPGLVDLCTDKVSSGDASILHELYRYRERTDLPSATPVPLWTVDALLDGYASA
jgi:hypothetical protein